MKCKVYVVDIYTKRHRLCGIEIDPSDSERNLGIFYFLHSRKYSRNILDKLSIYELHYFSISGEIKYYRKEIYDGTHEELIKKLKPAMKKYPIKSKIFIDLLNNAF